MSSQGNNCQEVYVNEEIIIKTETENVEDFAEDILESNVQVEINDPSNFSNSNQLLICKTEDDVVLEEQIKSDIKKRNEDWFNNISNPQKQQHGHKGNNNLDNNLEKKLFKKSPEEIQPPLSSKYHYDPFEPKKSYKLKWPKPAFDMEASKRMYLNKHGIVEDPEIKKRNEEWLANLSQEVDGDHEEQEDGIVKQRRGPYNKDPLRVSKYYHKGEKNHKCELCNKSFASASYLKKHISLIHYEDYHELELFKCEFKCEYCDKSFQDKDRLKKHNFKVHTFHEDYKCDFCGKSLASTHSLKTHIFLVHERQKDHKCDACSKSFSSAQYLKTHIKAIHEGIKEHKCDFCPYSFSTSSNLKSHIYTVHEGHKDHECDYFTTSKILKNHIHTVHGKHRDFQCQFCLKAFSSAHYLRKHLKSVHNEVSESGNSNFESGSSNFQEINIKTENEDYIEDQSNHENSILETGEEELVHEHDEQHYIESSESASNDFQAVIIKTENEDNFEFEPNNDEDILENSDQEEYDIDSTNVKIEQVDDEEIFDEPTNPEMQIDDGDENSYYDPHQYVQSELEESHIAISENENTFDNTTTNVKNEPITEDIQKQFFEKEKPYKCHLCNKHFKNKHNVQIHVRHIHEGQKSHKCDKCEKQFSQKSNLRTHVKIYHEGIRPDCQICGRDFATENYLLKHVSAVHDGAISCQFCSKAFLHEEGLNTHIFTVHESQNSNSLEKERPTFVCHLCNKNFTTKNAMLMHISNIHEGQKSHKCESCGKSFGQKSNLRTHVKTYHEGKRPNCDQCGKDFATENYLRKHIAAVHDGSRNFPCPFCSKAYLHKEGLNNHISTVHEGITYQCDFCNKSFTQSNNLKRHLKTAHQHEDHDHIEDEKDPFLDQSIEVEENLQESAEL